MTYDEYVEYGEPKVLVMTEKHVPLGAKHFQELRFHLSKGRKYVLSKGRVPSPATQRTVIAPTPVQLDGHRTNQKAATEGQDSNIRLSLEIEMGADHKESSV